MNDLGCTTYARLLDAVTAAHTIDLSGYILGRSMQHTLEAAAAAGVRVRVRLSARCFGPAAAQMQERNLAAVAEMRRSGIDAATADGPADHLKAAVIDGTAYLDDRNWSGDTDLIVADHNPHDLAALCRVLHGGAAGACGVALVKAQALEAEAAMIKSAPAGGVDAATETAGPSSITHILASQAAVQRVRLLVNSAAYGRSAAMRTETARLLRAGVEVRLSAANDKFAITGDRVWIGSANATASLPEMPDWGGCSGEPATVAALKARFAQAWATAKAVPNNAQVLARAADSTVSGDSASTSESF